MATGLAFSTLSGPTHLKKYEAWSAKSSSFVRTPVLINQRKLVHQRTNNNFSIRARYNDQRGGGEGDFIAGFLLGGAIFGALGYVFAPQIRRTILNENEYGFRRARRPIYYDDGLERTRETLNEKIHQLNSAIDNVSSRLMRGGKTMPPVPLETDPEEATM
ncbi:uncharacterized protein LOC116012025 [Ipomoea triloba]|uniref:uncharacterized protein LOC109179101 n=1 Tax=Ipomoea nil TaxID=35883 RepID=UPI000901DF51|nr:PREDICTED: uncharacterized protein LOC109179101 [Ipomoea nil]XP_031107345.1 uncharacterized protein LOC116012025 [Ipomoea triloba]GLL19880.1 uncharacterized protein LOC109179101 [Ipomoea trifida]